MADRIQADKVDILVDLSGHSAGHRLHRVRAQARADTGSRHGESGTGTGLPTIDYFLADPVRCLSPRVICSPSGSSICRP